MGFEDLAKHMAARDGRKKSQVQATDPDRIVAEALKSDRRMRRTRDLVLGPLLLAGGLGLGLIVYSVLRGGGDTGDPRNAGVEDSGGILLACGGFACVAIIAGLLKTIRGLTSRSLVGDAPERMLEGLDPHERVCSRPSRRMKRSGRGHRTGPPLQRLHPAATPQDGRGLPRPSGCQ